MKCSNVQRDEKMCVGSPSYRQRPFFFALLCWNLLLGLAQPNADHATTDKALILSRVPEVRMIDTSFEGTLCPTARMQMPDGTRVLELERQ
ncbi:hypothetical protein GE09DRAFT_510854 [Coniochaeta sp. 2T2.1]|nr:hypothetical protein GE09DRAFT_510854 [Coniochaeta sp. 2T2.1]